jgi:hypothetical protein
VLDLYDRSELLPPVVLSPFHFPVIASAGVPPPFPTRFPLNHAAPLEFLAPEASPSSPLAPQPDTTQLPTPLRRDFTHLEPPLVGAARARSSRRQPPLPDPKLHQVYKQFPCDPLMLVRPSLARVRRPFAGNGDVPPRPPHSSVGRPVFLLLIPCLYVLCASLVP